MSEHILHIDSSARINGSLSREMSRYVAAQLQRQLNVNIIHQDLSAAELPLVTEAHIGAYYTPADQRTEEQKQLLVASDKLIDELKATKHLVIGAPIYNFSVPAALKAWIDLVCRVGETFVYQDGGPQGLLDIDHAYIIVAAGGTPIGSEIDFNSKYLQQVCRFIGVKQTHIIAVSGSKQDPEALIEAAKQQVERILLTTLAA